MALTAHEKRQLELALGCSSPQLPAMLRKYDDAAREEYLSMMLGQKVFTRGQDIREYRLFLIIQHVFAGELPPERTISNLFQTTASQSRSLLRAVLSKFQYQMRQGVEETIRKTLRTATQPAPGGPWRIQTDSENLIEQLNREISNVDPVLTQVSRAAQTVGSFEIPNASYLRLRAHFGL